MTKLRDPLTFGQAITRIAGVLGWEETASIVGKGKRLVRLWSEPDKRCNCTLDQARNLDAAYRAAGGEGAPLLEAYAFQLEFQIARENACRHELAETIAEVSREAGEAVAASVAILNPRASPTDLHRALADVGEAQSSIAKLMRRVTAIVAAIGKTGASQWTPPPPFPRR
jgi:hypothetical protein